MKTTLRVSSHLVRPGETVVEVWHDGQFVATIAGVDGVPGVHIISKYTLAVTSSRGEDLIVQPREGVVPLAEMVVSIGR